MPVRVGDFFALLSALSTYFPPTPLFFHLFPLKPTFQNFVLFGKVCLSKINGDNSKPIYRYFLDIFLSHFQVFLDNRLDGLEKDLDIFGHFCPR